jgi:hypothetical protein
VSAPRACSGARPTPRARASSSTLSLSGQHTGAHAWLDSTQKIDAQCSSAERSEHHYRYGYGVRCNAYPLACESREGEYAVLQAIVHSARARAGDADVLPGEGAYDVYCIADALKVSVCCQSGSSDKRVAHPPGAGALLALSGGEETGGWTDGYSQEGSAGNCTAAAIVCVMCLSRQRSAILRQTERRARMSASERCLLLLMQ